VLLLDEPTVGADPQTRQALLAVVAQRAAAGAAVVYTTHYLPELTELGATLAVARAGRIIARGSQAELLAGLSGEVRLTFAGPVPAALRRHGDADAHELRVTTREPAAALARLLAAGASPDSVDIRKPGLDDLYRSLATDSTSPGSTGPGSTSPDSTGPGSTGPGSTSPDSTSTGENAHAA
jgi:ABC-2 type transport system ATP-binding protein